MGLQIAMIGVVTQSFTLSLTCSFKGHLLRAWHHAKGFTWILSLKLCSTPLSEVGTIQCSDMEAAAQTGQGCCPRWHSQKVVLG